MTHHCPTFLILGNLFAGFAMSVTAAGTDGGLAYPVDFTYSVAMGPDEIETLEKLRAAA